MSNAARTPLSAKEEARLKYLWAEWELIQKKVDSVSSFPFTVKAWTVALSAALIGLAKGLGSPSLLIFLTPLIPLIFWLVESKHNFIKDTLTKRADQLERVIGATLNHRKVFSYDILGSLQRVPGVAHTLSAVQKSLKRDKIVLRRPAGEKFWAWNKQNWDVLKLRLALEWSDVTFYIGHFIILLVICIVLYSAEKKSKACPEDKAPQTLTIPPPAVVIPQPAAPLGPQPPAKAAPQLSVPDAPPPQSVPQPSAPKAPLRKSKGKSKLI